MSLSNPNKPVTEEGLAEFYNRIKPYMGSESGSGGHTIEDSEGTALTQRDTLQFGEGFSVEDDSENEKTVISPNVMPSEDMSEVIDPLPPVMPYTSDSMVEKNGLVLWNGTVVFATYTQNIYVDYVNGVDDFESGYGYSTTKPFKTIEYMTQFIAHQSTSYSSGSMYAINIHLMSDFTRSEFKRISFKDYALRLNLYVDSDITLTNYSFGFESSTCVILTLNGDLTINITDNTSNNPNCLFLQSCPLFINGTSGKKLILQGHSGMKNNANLIYATMMARLVINDAIEVQGVNGASLLYYNWASMGYVNKMSGSNLQYAITAYQGSRVSFETNNTGVNVRGLKGGRVYSGTQS